MFLTDRRQQQAAAAPRAPMEPTAFATRETPEAYIQRVNTDGYCIIEGGACMAPSLAACLTERPAFEPQRTAMLPPLRACQAAPRGPSHMSPLASQ